MDALLNARMEDCCGIAYWHSNWNSMGEGGGGQVFEGYQVFSLSLWMRICCFKTFCPCSFLISSSLKEPVETLGEPAEEVESLDLASQDISSNILYMSKDSKRQSQETFKSHPIGWIFFFKRKPPLKSMQGQIISAAGSVPLTVADSLGADRVVEGQSCVVLQTIHVVPIGTTWRSESTKPHLPTALGTFVEHSFVSLFLFSMILFKHRPCSSCLSHALVRQSSGWGAATNWLFGFRNLKKPGSSVVVGFLDGLVWVVVGFFWFLLFPWKGLCLLQHSMSRLALLACLLSDGGFLQKTQVLRICKSRHQASAARHMTYKKKTIMICLSTLQQVQWIQLFTWDLHICWQWFLDSACGQEKLCVLWQVAWEHFVVWTLLIETLNSPADLLAQSWPCLVPLGRPSFAAAPAVVSSTLGSLSLTFSASMSFFGRFLVAVVLVNICEAGTVRGSKEERRTIAVKEVQAGLQAALKSVPDGDKASMRRSARIEECVWQTFQALPKNNLGRLNPRGARYLVHNYFVKEHGWMIQGLDPRGNQADVSEVHEVVILQDKAPALVESLSLCWKHNDPIMALHWQTLWPWSPPWERLIFHESLSLLRASYVFNDVSMLGEVEQNSMDNVLTSYLLLFQLGNKGNLSDAGSHHALKSRVSRRDDWPSVVDFQQDAMMNFNYARKHHSNPFVAPYYTSGWGWESRVWNRGVR